MKTYPVKHPKPTHWIFYLIIFISLEILIFFGLRHNYEDQKKIVANQYVNNLRNTHQIVVNTLGLVSQTIFNEVINQSEFIELFKQANQSTPEQQQRLRQQLYQKLQPSYERLKQQQLKHITFYLADNTGFLNFNLDEDALHSLTEMALHHKLQINFDTTLPQQGFREGVQGGYFRYIFPLLAQQERVASVEIGMSLEAIVAEMIKVQREHYDIIIKKSVFSTDAGIKHPKNFQASSLSNDFLQQQTAATSFIQKKFSPSTLRLLPKINYALSQQVAAKLKQEYPFVEFVLIESQSYSATFLPLENINDKTIGYLISYAVNTDITTLSQNFYLHLLILSLTNTFFIFFLFQANRNRYIAEYQRENLATSNAILERWVDERVSELIETNISLHQEIFDRKKAEEELQIYQDHLEELVAERTLQLSDVNDELCQFNRERIEDIVKLRQTEMALRESEDMFRTMSQSLIDALIVINSLGNVMFWSKSAEKIFGYTEAEVLGRNLHTFILPSGITPEISQSFVKFRESGEGRIFNQLLELNALRKNGEHFPVEISIVAIRLKNEWNAMGTIRDITDRKQKEQELQAAMSAMEQANRIIAEKNREISDNYLELQQTLDHLQTAQRELVQSEKMAALGQLIAGVAHEINTPLGAISSSVSNIDSFVHQHLAAIPAFFRTLPAERHDDFFALLHHAAAQQGLLTSKEKRHYRKALTLQLQEIALLTPELFADKLVEVGVYHDITPWKALLQSPDSQSVLDMAYQIMGLQKSTKTIALASERAAKVVFALKSFARFDHSGKKIRVHLLDGIETVLTLYYSKLKFGVEVQRNYAEIPKIYCFPDELNQVWTNLIHNALQAMNNQGVLTIQTAVKDQAIMVSITDTGSGIPEAIRERIFEPFFTTKPVGEGSGLGLDIVKKIIEKHGGRIELHSVIDKGTTFHIFLPIVLESSEVITEP